MKHSKQPRLGDFIKVNTSDETYYEGDIGTVDDILTLYYTGAVYLLISWITYKRIPRLTQGWIAADRVERIFRPANKKERLVFYSACLNGRFADNNKY